MRPIFTQQNISCKVLNTTLRSYSHVDLCILPNFLIIELYRLLKHIH